MARLASTLRNSSFFVAIVTAASIGAVRADAASPAVVIASAPIVSPTAALTYYGSPVSPAVPSVRDPLVAEMARSLRYDVDLIFEHVRDNVVTVPMFGLLKGARGVVLDNAGTPFDQAQFMVDLLRESDAVMSRGYNPAYVLGQISLTGSQFASMTGISDAAQATKLLSSGGIPATVTGMGSSFSVVMLHPWVRVTIGGSDYLFDPSYKSNTTSAPLAWQGQTGYVQATLLAAGGGGTGTTISGFNVSAFRQQLDSYRASLETYIAANAAGKRAAAVIGTSNIVPHLASENRRTSLPHVTSTDRIWAGQIPDAFRTAFSVQLNGTTYASYFADVVGGKVQGFTYNLSGTNFVASGIEPGPVIAGTFSNPCDQYQSDRSDASSPAVASVTINHPYAANGGTYADRTISRQLTAKQCANGSFYVSNDWGFTGTGITRRISPAAASIRAQPPSLNFVFAPTLANVASQYSALLDFASNAQNNSYQVHDVIGIHTLDNVSMNLDPPNTMSLAASLSMDFEAAVSAFSKNGTSAGDVTAAYTAGLGLSYVESAVPRQEADAVYDMAALSLVTQQDTRATISGTYTTYLATPATWNTVKNSLSEYPSDAVAAASSYVAEGYSILAPQKGALRQPRITVADVNTRTSSLWEGSGPGSTASEVKRSAFIAWRPTGGIGPIPDRIAAVIYDQRRGSILKAGVGVPVAANSANTPLPKPEAPKAMGKDFIRAALNVDPRSGALLYAPNPDLVDGAGEFPRALSFQRVYDQRDPTNYGLGIGWKSNWYQVATLSNDGQAALGRGGAQAIASTLVGIQALGDLVTTQDAQHIYAAAQAAAWMADQTINNSIVISRGLDSDVAFYRQASNTFVSGKADGATLSLTGSASTGIINRRLYVANAVAYTDVSGAIRNYFTAGGPFGRDLSSPDIAALFAKKGLYLTDWNFPNGVQIKTTYNSSVATPQVFHLQQVSNNLGSAIYRTIYDFGSISEVPYCNTAGGRVLYNNPYPSVIGYKTPSSPQVLFNMDAQIGWRITVDPDTARCNPGTLTPPAVTYQWPSQLRSKTDPFNAKWLVGYSSASGLYAPVMSLGSVSKPSSASPDIVIGYGADSNVTTFTNLRGNNWQYFSSISRSEILPPVESTAAGRGNVTYADRYGQVIRSLDPLLRTTGTEYDDRGRAHIVTKPEGDQTVIDYDVRGNPIQETRKAKPGTALPDIVSSAGYIYGPTVSQCANPALCNKVSYTIDARGFRSNYTWDPTTGELLSSNSGYDGSGTTCMIPGNLCPSTTFGYTASLSGYDPTTGTASGTLRLPSSKLIAVTGSSAAQTSYGYILKTFGTDYTPMSNMPVRRIVLNEAVTETGTESLRTCFGYDLGGNVLTDTRPRAGLSSCP